MTIEYTKEAQKQIGGLDKATKQRIRKAINALPLGDIKKLKGYTSKFRIRVGEYRVIYDLEGDVIRIGMVLPRGSAYKKL